MPPATDLAMYVDGGDNSTTAYWGVTRWNTGTTATAGTIVRQRTTPSTNNERAFVCVVAGVTSASTEPSWSAATRGQKFTDNTVTWQECTGVAALNGDQVHTPTWAQLKAVTTPSLGWVIQDNGGVGYQICTTAGSLGASQPSFSSTAGVTTSESGGTAVWTSLGAIRNWTSWAAPHARIQNACATNWNPFGYATKTGLLSTAGGYGTVYVSDRHAESQASAMTIAPALAADGTFQMLCVDHTVTAGSVGFTSANLKNTATCKTTGINQLGINFSTGYAYVYGITFSGSDGSTFNAGVTYASSANAETEFDNCVFAFPGTNGVGQLGATSGTRMLFNQTQFNFGHTASYLDLRTGEYYFKNCSPLLVTGATGATASAIPANLLGAGASSNFTAVTFDSCDLSLLTGAFLKQAVTTMQGWYVIKDCALNTSFSVPQAQSGNTPVQVLGSQTNVNQAYFSSRYTFEGLETTESNYVRTGGAVDPIGNTQSRRFQPYWAAPNYLRPLKAEPMLTYNSKVGSNVTVTVYGLTGLGRLPNNDEIWTELEYYGTSGTTQGKILSGTKANVLATGSPQSSDSSTWGFTSSVSMDGPSGGVSFGTPGIKISRTSTGICYAFSNLWVDTGKYYFEAKCSVNVTNNTFIGLSKTLTVSDFASGYNQIGVQLGSGNSIVIASNATFTTLGADSSTDEYDFAIDLTNKLLWVRLNNGNWNNNVSANPATGVGGATIEAGAYAPTLFFASGSTNNDTVALNFGASAFTNTAPSGFGNLVNAWTPFKMQFLLDTTHNPQPQIAGPITARCRIAYCNRGVHGTPVGPLVWIDPVIVLS